LVGGLNAFTILNVDKMLGLADVKTTKIIAIAFVTDEAIGYTTRWKLGYGDRRG
jgi:hypothetical protein